MGARWKKRRKQRLKKAAKTRQANQAELAQQVAATDASTPIKVEADSTKKLF